MSKAPFTEDEDRLAPEEPSVESPEPRRRYDPYGGFRDILSLNKKMLRIKDIARQVADTDVPVLITGEPGVGKEVVARFIHVNSRRRDRPFVKVNCAALPHELLESELFGHERGAFTGAHTDKPGKFELADRGTILLDEIGEMSPLLQAKLLHVLQDGEFTRLGGRHPVRVDARVVAATNKRLEEAVGKGEFRADLYFRLNVIRIAIPPLRERREDLPLLLEYFLKRYLEKYKGSVHQLPEELLESLLRYDWPGNVRQLENVIKRFVILPDIEIALDEVRLPGSPAPAAAPPPPAAQPVPVREITGPVSLKEIAGQAAEQAERAMVLRILNETQWNRKQAARRLNICYKALLNKLKKWQITKIGTDAV